MKLFEKKEKTDLLGAEEQSGKIQIYEKDRERLIFIISTLFIFLQEFTLDLNEIDSERFKKMIDQLKDSISKDDDSGKVAIGFEKKKKKILSYIEKQKSHIVDKEQELKDIIELLTKAMAAIDAENLVFNQTVYSQSEKLEEITHLDDIKTVKKRIEQEIDNIKKAVRKKQAYDKEQVEFLSKKVDSLSDELEKAKIASMTDGLTGVYNRKAFDSYLIELIEKNAGKRSPFSLFILDIDDFKNINDTYGHQVGDRIILTLILKCREFVRDKDYVARYGGDEFVVILPGASLRNAVKRAGQIRKAIAASKYSIDDSNKDVEISFTTSIGVSTFRKGDTVSTIMERADNALYAAKERGKNSSVSEKEL